MVFRAMRKRVCGKPTESVGRGVRTLGTMTDSGFRPTGVSGSHADATATSFASLEPRDQLLELLRERAAGKPFSELSAVTFDHRGVTVVGHLLLDALEDAGYSVDDFDAVGALTAAAVPLGMSVVQAAASRGEDIDGFVMDFVYPSIKGPSIKGRRVVLLDAWLSEKSYVQTSSLVTLRNGNELSLDFSVVEHEGANVVAVASMVGGLGGDDAKHIEVINPVTDERHELPFVQLFDEAELR